MWRGTAAVLLVALYSGPAQASECTSNAAEIVGVLYSRILQRHPDAASQQLIQALSSGRITVRDAVMALVRSEEHQTNLWIPIVDATFRQIRNASPEPDGVMNLARGLARGTRSLDEVVTSLAVEEAGTLSPDAAVIALYRRLLGRDPSPEDVERNAHAVANAGVEALVRAIVGSAEYRQRFGPNGVPAQGGAAYERSVRVLYKDLLGRDADADGLARYTNVAMQSGFTLVADQIVRSEEYERSFGAQGIPGAPAGHGQFCSLP